MSYKLAIASGKGGTGKTTVAVNLFHLLNKNYCRNIQLVDCDVEEPNDHIFFPGKDKKGEIDVHQLVPVIDTERCTYCRKCVEYCEFNAIVVIPNVEFAEVNPGLCHSCGACSVACNYNAIQEVQKSVGKIIYYSVNEGNGLMEGRLEIGSAMQTMLIRELKSKVPDTNEIIIYDAPPGTSCPVVETVSDCDYIILVTEPTPFGLHDLKLMVDLLIDIQKPYGVIVNKAGLGSNDVYQYLERNNIDFLGEIPFEIEYAGLYANGDILEANSPGITGAYEKIIKKLERRLLVYEGDHYFKW